MNKVKNEILLKWIFYVLLAGGVLGIAILIYKIYRLGNLNFDKLSYDVIGVVGDFVGGFIGTLFTIATIILVWLTYQSQKQELQLNQELIKEQNYESSFFKLIDLLKSIVENMDLRIMKRKYQTKDKDHFTLELDHVVYGRDCFQNLTNTCISHAKKMSLAEAASLTYTNNESDLGPYFGILRTIIKKINENKNNKFYIETFNAILSGYELSLINYMMHSDKLSETEKELICKFQTLERLDISKLGSMDHKYQCTLYNK
ncbi:MAG: hypothetical protein IPL56_05440 [Saprospiraceae bacterium]|nr:hypothetical protein [Saprospiraceae bacterium]